MQQTFEAVIREGRGGGAFVEVPFDVEAVFGSARPKVLVTFDGVPYRGSIARMGGMSLIGVLKEIRSRIGKQPGERVRITVIPDEAARVLPVPDDLRAALRRAKLEAAFEKLSYSHRREHIRAINEAKKPETRQRRIEKTVDMLQARRTR